MQEQRMSFGNDPGVSGEAKRKAEIFAAKAEAAAVARLAGRTSLRRRVLDRLQRRRQQ
jgi:hypothetical protein